MKIETFFQTNPVARCVNILRMFVTRECLPNSIPLIFLRNVGLIIQKMAKKLEIFLLSFYYAYISHHLCRIEKLRNTTKATKRHSEYNQNAEGIEENK